MNKIKDYIISKGAKEIGVSIYDIQNNILTPSEFDQFNVFMRGQTAGFLDNSGTCPIVYTEDLLRFLDKRPIID